jgi:hypothetical protein
MVGPGLGRSWERDFSEGRRGGRANLRAPPPGKLVTAVGREGLARVRGRAHSVSLERTGTRACVSQGLTSETCRLGPVAAKEAFSPSGEAWTREANLGIVSNQPSKPS